MEKSKFSIPPALISFIPFCIGVFGGYQYYNYTLIKVVTLLTLVSIIKQAYDLFFSTKIKSLSPLFHFLFIFFSFGYIVSSSHYNSLSSIPNKKAKERVFTISSIISNNDKGISLVATEVDTSKKEQEKSLLLLAPSSNNIKIDDKIYLKKYQEKFLSDIHAPFQKHKLLRLNSKSHIKVIQYTHQATLKKKSVKAYAEMARDYCASQIQSMGLTELQKEILLAMTLGIKSSYNSQSSLLFRKTGAAHLLSVSGFHLFTLSIFLSLLLSPLLLFKSSSYLRPIILILMAWIFCFISGLNTATIRAAFMLSIYELSQFLERPNHSLNTLSFTALILLLFHPAFIFDIGFWMSFLALGSIILFFPLFLQTATWIRIPFLNWFYQSLSMTLAAQFLIIPLLFYLFGNSSLTFLWSSIPLLLFASILIPLTLLYIVLSLFIGSLSFLEQTIIKLSSAMETCLHFFEKHFQLSINIKFSSFELLGAYLLVAAFYMFWKLYLNRRISI